MPSPSSFFDSRFPIVLLRFFLLLGHEWHARLRLLQPLRSGRAHEGNDGMNQLAISGTRLRRLDPGVPGEAGWNHDVLIRDRAAGTSKSCGISNTWSGLPMLHPSAHATAGGASFGSPSRAPPSTQETSVSISPLASERSFANFP